MVAVIGNLYVCNGCGGEFSVENDGVFCQGKNQEEKYCRMCNKKFPEFLKRRQEIWGKYDKLKWDETKSMRAEVFGTSKAKVEVSDETKTDLQSRVGK